MENIVDKASMDNIENCKKDEEKIVKIAYIFSVFCMIIMIIFGVTSLLRMLGLFLLTPMFMLITGICNAFSISADGIYSFVENTLDNSFEIVRASYYYVLIVTVLVIIASTFIIRNKGKSKTFVNRIVWFDSIYAFFAVIAFVFIKFFG